MIELHFFSLSNWISHGARCGFLRALDWRHVRWIIIIISFFLALFLEITIFFQPSSKNPLYQPATFCQTIWWRPYLTLPPAGWAGATSLLHDKAQRLQNTRSTLRVCVCVCVCWTHVCLVVFVLLSRLFDVCVHRQHDQAAQLQQVMEKDSPRVFTHSSFSFRSCFWGLTSVKCVVSVVMSFKIQGSH